MIQDYSFRTVLRGFDKEEVMDCVTRMDAELAKIRTDLETAKKESAVAAKYKASALKNEDLKEKLTAAANALAAKNQELSALSAQLEEERRKAAAAVQNAEQLAAQLEEERRKAAAAVSNTEQLAAQLADVTKKSEESSLALQYQEKQLAALQTKNQQLVDRTAQTEDPAKQVGDVIIEAHRIADDIVKNAEERASTLTSNAQLAVNRIAEEISSLHSDLDNISTVINANTLSMQTRVAEMTAAVENAQKKFVDRFSEGKKEENAEQVSE